jgi:hypothetical protein
LRLEESKTGALQVHMQFSSHNAERAQNHLAKHL